MDSWRMQRDRRSASRFEHLDRDLTNHRKSVRASGTPRTLKWRTRGSVLCRDCRIVDRRDPAKDLNGLIMSWNRGAELFFGYTAEEAVGRPVTILISRDRHDEEPAVYHSDREAAALGRA
jgi:hypothetical protein